jgi:hypothetical protein
MWAEVSPVPAQMWAGASAVPAQTWGGGERAVFVVQIALRGKAEPMRRTALPTWWRTAPYVSPIQSICEAHLC